MLLYAIENNMHSLYSRPSLKFAGPGENTISVAYKKMLGMMNRTNTSILP